MKKSSLILNVILLIAVVVLYILHFTAGKSSGGVAPAVAGDTASVGEMSIVFVNMDTLLANYDMFSDLQDRLQKKQMDSESKLNARGQKWQTKVSEFQNNLQRGLVTRSEAQKIQAQLEQEQQQILQMKDDLASRLMEEQQVGSRKVIFSIVDFLNDYSRQHHYRYVLSTTVGGAVLYGDKQLDITEDVLAGLNEQYKSVRDSLLKAQ
jgi:outer membrane protein